VDLLDRIGVDVVAQAGVADIGRRHGAAERHAGLLRGQPRGAPDLSAARAGFDTGAFAALNQTAFAFGLEQEVIWITFKLRNTLPRAQSVMLDPGLFTLCSQIDSLFGPAASTTILHVGQILDGTIFCRAASRDKLAAGLSHIQGMIDGLGILGALRAKRLGL